MKRQIAYIQWLRVLAALAVVVMHTESVRWLSISHETKQWLVLTAYDGLVRWPVCIFIMITGAIFLPRQTTLGQVLKRYIPRFAAAFLVWSGIYAGYELYRGASSGEALVLFAEGKYHLWYLPYLCGVYLTLPFLQHIARDSRLTGQLLAVSCVAGLLIPWAADVAELLLPAGSRIIRSLESSVNYTFFMDLLALLLLGHWLHQTELTPGARRLLYAAGILSAALTGPATVWASNLAGIQSSVFCQIGAPNNVCAAAALFVFAKHHLTRLPRAVETAAACSFGIYLSHALILDVLEDMGYHVLTWNPIWSVPVLSAAVFALSLAVTQVLRRIPKVEKYLV